MNNKLILSSLLFSLTLTGCASMEMVPAYKQDSITFKSNASDVYHKAVECALDNISVPTEGSFFSYQSEENQSYALTYLFNFVPSDPLLSLPSKGKGTLRVNVHEKDVSIKVTNIQEFHAPNAYSTYSGWSDIVMKGQVESAQKPVKSMLESLKSCIQ